jgi:hypothetical protein
MPTATTQIRRTVALAAALGAVVASGASARVPEAEPARGSSQAVSHGARPAAAPPSMADIAARREARAISAWRAANPPRIIEVSSSDDGGFDLLSAGIGAAAPLMLVLVELTGRRIWRRRHDSEVRHQLA